SSQSVPTKRLSVSSGLIAVQGWNVACLGTMASTKSNALWIARPTRLACFPGEARRCNCQSEKASASAAGERPPVKRASAAWKDPSRASTAISEAGGGAGVVPTFGGAPARTSLEFEAVGMRPTDAGDDMVNSFGPATYPYRPPAD